MPPPQRLILKDEHSIAAELTWRLTCVSYAVVTRGGSGAEAIERAPELCPDLALADIGLPGGMAGLEAAAHIWEECKIPVVYVTAYADEPTLTQARTPVPVLAIRKPLDIRQLPSTLGQALS
ncbi:MAG: response regulator [Candidatus Entotheonellia bacterium]